MDGDVETKVLSTTFAKCKNCGSELVFDPESKALKCSSCDSTFPFESVVDNSKHDLDLKAQSKSTDEWSKESKMVKCRNCGAEVVINGLAVTQKCPYCGSEYVVEMDELPGLKPDCVIPFSYGRKTASEKFAAGVKKKFFVPSKFKKQLPIENIRGIYIPAFDFDAKTKSSYRGVLARTKTVRTKNGTKTVTERFNISGNYNYNYCDLLIESSTKMDDSQLRSILPFHVKDSCKFTDNFLRGFYVEHYNDSIDKCYSIAKEKVDDIIKSNILSGYNYSYVVSFNKDTVTFDEKYNYQLLPVYYVECEYNKKKYTSLMNGQTGKVGSGLPISPLKVSLTILAGVLVIALIVVLLVLFGGN